MKRIADIRIYNSFCWYLYLVGILGLHISSIGKAIPLSLYLSFEWKRVHGLSRLEFLRQRMTCYRSFSVIFQYIRTFQSSLFEGAVVRRNNKCGRGDLFTSVSLARLKRLPIQSTTRIKTHSKIWRMFYSFERPVIALVIGCKRGQSKVVNVVRLSSKGSTLPRGTLFGTSTI